MRDDIHRRLPLPKAWRRFVGACNREAERSKRNELALQAARSELKNLRPSVLRECHVALEASRDSLLPRLVFNPNCVPASPIEQSVLRYCLALAKTGGDPEATIATALCGALKDCVESKSREIRSQLALDDPSGYTKLRHEVAATICQIDLARVAIDEIRGTPRPKARRLPFDTDADIRGLT